MDDDPQVTATVIPLLVRKKFTAKSRKTPSAAMLLVDRELKLAIVDYIFADIDGVHSSGLQFGEALISRASDVIAILYTAHVTRDLEQRASSIGFCAVVDKREGITALGSTIDKFFHPDRPAEDRAANDRFYDLKADTVVIHGSFNGRIFLGNNVNNYELGDTLQNNLEIILERGLSQEELAKLSGAFERDRNLKEIVFRILIEGGIEAIKVFIANTLS